MNVTSPPLNEYPWPISTQSKTCSTPFSMLSSVGRPVSPYTPHACLASVPESHVGQDPCSTLTGALKTWVEIQLD